MKWDKFIPAKLPDITLDEMMTRFGLSEEAAKVQLNDIANQKIFINNLYQVNMRELEGGLTHLSIKRLDKEIKEIEMEVMKKTGELTNVSKQTAIKKIKGKFGKDIAYIG